MLKLHISWNIVRKVLNYLLVLVFMIGIGYLGYLTYFFATNSPKEVRVTNITGTSATISWYTNRLDKGEVVYKDKNNFIPLLSKIGAKVGYDERDVVRAQADLMNKLTDKAAKKANADYEVSLDSERFSNLKVTKKDSYYVHQVTVTGLENQKEYYFRVGNGLFWWNVNKENQKYTEIEAPTVNAFSFRTYLDPEELKAPNPAYGQVLSLARNKDGYLISNPSTDAIIFAKVLQNGNIKESTYQSSLVNNEGGWVIDKTGFRNSEGVLFSQLVDGVDRLQIYTQFENVNPAEKVELTVGSNDSPAQNIIGNSDNQARVRGSLLDILKLSLKEKSSQIYVSLTSPILARVSELPEDCGTGETWSATQGCIVKPPVSNTPSTGGSSASISCKYNTGCTTTKTVKVATRSECDDLQAEFDDSKCGETTPPASETPVNAACPASKPCTTVNSKGETVADNSSTWSQAKCACIKKSSVDEYANCTGQYPRTCDEAPLGGSTTNCFCQKADGGYLPLRGIDCRPAGCGNNRNNDLVCAGGVCDQRTKCPATKPSCDPKEEILCGTDYTTPGCGGKEQNCARTPETPDYDSVTNSCYKKSTFVCTINGTTYPKLTLSGCEEQQKIIDAAGNGYSNGNGYVPPAYVCVVAGVRVTKFDNNRVECEKLISAAPITPTAFFDNLRSGDSCCADGGGGDFVRMADPVHGCLKRESKDAVCKEKCTGIGMVRNSVGKCVCDTGKIPDYLGGCYTPSTSNVPNTYGGCKNRNCGYVVTDNTTEIIQKEFCGTLKGDCGPTQKCELISDNSGVCKDTGVVIGVNITNNIQNLNSSDYSIYNVPDSFDSESMFETHYECCKYSGVGDTTSSNYQLIDDKNVFKNDCKSLGGGWVKEDMDVCMEKLPDGKLNQKLDFVNNTYAANEIQYTENGNYIVTFPESGVVSLDINNNSKNLYVNKNNKYFFYTEKNGQAGYQAPANPAKPTSNDDLLVKTVGKKISATKIGNTYPVKLQKGINLISFGYLPTKDGKTGLKATEFIDIINGGLGEYVKSVSYFDGGKWAGGVVYDRDSGEIKGTDFALVPGKGYAIFAFNDVQSEIPGMKVLEGVPFALSSGWNLIGVNGYSKTYTSSSLIDSINEITGLKSNNVTWWPTSKGRYESFQKSEGVEYGFEFPILNDMGYFVRISEFKPESSSTKSIIWNPGTDLNGQPGSEQ